MSAEWQTATAHSGGVWQSAYVQVDEADDALAAVQRLKDSRDAYRELQAKAHYDGKLARAQLAEVHNLLEELGIPSHCASGQVLTFAQRVVIALQAAPSSGAAR